MAAGDIDGDTTDDLIIGAQEADPAGGSGAGETYVIYGGGSLPATIDLNECPVDPAQCAGLTVYGDDAGDRSGHAVVAGDIDGDTTGDLIIGANGADPTGGGVAGETYVIYGGLGLPSTIDLDSTSAGLTVYGDDVQDLSAISVAAGDIDRDTADDLIIGARQADSPGISTDCVLLGVGDRCEAGGTYVIHGGPQPTPQSCPPEGCPTPTNTPTPTMTLTPACAPARPHGPGDFDRAITTSAGRQREYLLHVPPSYAGTDALPLVLNLHGFDGTAHDQASYSQLPAKADEAGFILVSPQGTETTFQPGRHWNFTMLAQLVEPDEPDDVAFIAELLDALESELCIDATRVFSTGFSNGGWMTSRLGCSLSQRIAAIAPMSGVYFPPWSTGLPFEPGCNSTRPVPILAFHGTADMNVPFDGGTTGDVLGFDISLRDIDDEIMPDWAAHNGCDSLPTEERVMENVRLVRYQGCHHGATVELYAIEGGEHVWYEHQWPAEEFSANDVLWDFFVAHPMPTLQEPPPSAEVPQSTATALPLAAPSAGTGPGSADGVPAWPVALLAGALALGGAAWYARRRLLG